MFSHGGLGQFNPVPIGRLVSRFRVASQSRTGGTCPVRSIASHANQSRPNLSRLWGQGGNGLTTCRVAPVEPTQTGRRRSRRARRTPSAAGPSVTLPPTGSDQQSRVSMGAEPTCKTQVTDGNGSRRAPTGPPWRLHRGSFAGIFSRWPYSGRTYGCPNGAARVLAAALSSEARGRTSWPTCDCPDNQEIGRAHV